MTAQTEDLPPIEPFILNAADELRDLIGVLDEDELADLIVQRAERLRGLAIAEQLLEGMVADGELVRTGPGEYAPAPRS